MSNKTLQWAGVFGITAGLVYVATTAAGSVLDSSYSQIRQHVSDLTATGAATSADLAPPYILLVLLVPLMKRSVAEKGAHVAAE